MDRGKSTLGVVIPPAILITLSASFNIISPDKFNEASQVTVLLDYYLWGRARFIELI